MGTDAGIRSSSTAARQQDPLPAWAWLGKGPRATYAEINISSAQKRAVSRVFFSNGRTVIAKRCRKAPVTLEAVAFDWATVGWGPPAADISQVHFPAYPAAWTTVGRSNSHTWGMSAWLGTMRWHKALSPGEVRSALARYPRSVAQAPPQEEVASRQSALRLAWTRL